MTTNITTLAINLLISERIDQRNALADRIIELLDNDDNSGNEKHIRDNFLLSLEICIQNPNSEIRDAFYRDAEYFAKKNLQLSPAA
jgi:hypothetical protein